MKKFISRILAFLLEKLKDGPRPISEDERIKAESLGRILDASVRAEATRQFQCTHRKGGMVATTGAWPSDGGDAQYAVRKHQIMNGDIWVDCIRCGKKWRPPIRTEYSSDRTFYQAIEEYEMAKLFPTRNVTSSSIQCAFTDPKTGADAAEEIRKMYAKLGA